MDKFFSVAQVIAPIFTAIGLGMLARKKQLLTQEQNTGFQQYVMKFGLPCLVFNSCLTAKMGLESVSSMAMVLVLDFGMALWAFKLGKKKFPYHNLPMMFAAQETGMLGIPLVIVLFGASQAYRMGVLDLIQGVVAYPVIAILTADTGESPSPGKIAQKVIFSPFMIMAVLGLALNLSGAGDWLDKVGLGAVITEAISFVSQPVSAVMLFSVGYNFSLEKGSRAAIFRLCGVHFAMYGLCCILIQAILCLIPGVDLLTRLVLLMYCTLPASYLTPSLGRSEEDYTVASGVCSLLTLVSLAIFCGITAAIA